MTEKHDPTGTAAESGEPGLRELRGGSAGASILVRRSPGAEGTCRGERRWVSASEAEGPHQRRGFCAVGARGPGLSGPAGSAGVRGTPGEPAKPGRCEALMKKDDSEVGRRRRRRGGRAQAAGQAGGRRRLAGGRGAPSPPPACPQDQHHFLRSSVRPQSKRLRKDSSCAGGSGGAGGSGPRGKGADGGGSSSGNGSGAVPAAPAGGSRSSSRNLGSSSGEKEEGKKARRQWESWSTEDKNTFFEGLYEHGKDFEAIQNNIALKYKKKGKPASMVKNKEQVRHFYYRTWHKITKYIDFDNGEVWLPPVSTCHACLSVINSPFLMLLFVSIASLIARSFRTFVSTNVTHF
ncbi:protein cramped-like [Leptonychotes weddellii]|uniref:Protein cramped-like n=1 Tax=Leptonychotes weddellii TaxID=9713 RepID=A0A7F8RJJ6_LEPWE|nr:protein cramped-like [Leptonychotes weddellii]